MKNTDLKNIAELKQTIDKGGTIKIKLESGKIFYMSNDNIRQAAVYCKDNGLDENETTETILKAYDLFDGSFEK